MKFKIWNNILEKFVDGSEWYVNPSGQVFFEDMMNGGLVMAVDDIYKVLRFTGLHDLYGQEIYEGDLVSLYYHHENIKVDVYEIKYGSGKWMLDDWECLTEYYLDHTPKFGDVCRVVKIGNVFEKRVD
jgi:hypothetical protein